VKHPEPSAKSSDDWVAAACAYALATYGVPREEFIWGTSARRTSPGAFTSAASVLIAYAATDRRELYLLEGRGHAARWRRVPASADEARAADEDAWLARARAYVTRAHPGSVCVNGTLDARLDATAVRTTTGVAYAATDARRLFLLDRSIGQWSWLEVPETVLARVADDAAEPVAYDTTGQFTITLPAGSASLDEWMWRSRVHKRIETALGLVTTDAGPADKRVDSKATFFLATDTRTVFCNDSPIGLPVKWVVTMRFDDPPALQKASAASSGATQDDSVKAWVETVQRHAAGVFHVTATRFYAGTLPGRLPAYRFAHGSAYAAIDTRQLFLCEGKDEAAVWREVPATAVLAKERAWCDAVLQHAVDAHSVLASRFHFGTLAGRPRSSLMDSWSAYAAVDTHQLFVLKGLESENVWHEVPATSALAQARDAEDGAWIRATGKRLRAWLSEFTYESGARIADAKGPVHDGLLFFETETRTIYKAVRDAAYRHVWVVIDAQDRRDQAAVKNAPNAEWLAKAKAYYEANLARGEHATFEVSDIAPGTSRSYDHGSVHADPTACVAWEVCKGDGKWTLVPPATITAMRPTERLGRALDGSWCATPLAQMTAAVATATAVENDNASMAAWIRWLADKTTSLHLRMSSDPMIDVVSLPLDALYVTYDAGTVRQVTSGTAGIHQGVPREDLGREAFERQRAWPERVRAFASRNKRELRSGSGLPGGFSHPDAGDIFLDELNGRTDVRVTSGEVWETLTEEEVAADEARYATRGSFADFRAQCEKADRMGQRPGQFASNFLLVAHPDIWERFRARTRTPHSIYDPSADPFYVDANLPAFWAWLEAHWSDGPEEKTVEKDEKTASEAMSEDAFIKRVRTYAMFISAVDLVFGAEMPGQSRITRHDVVYADVNRRRVYVSARGLSGVDWSDVTEFQLECAEAKALHTVVRPDPTLSNEDRAAIDAWLERVDRMAHAAGLSVVYGPNGFQPSPFGHDARCLYANTDTGHVYGIDSTLDGSPVWELRRPYDFTASFRMTKRRPSEVHANPKPRLDKLVETALDDAADATLRVAGRQLLRAARDPLAAVLARHLAPDDAALRGRAAAFLQTELGEALFAFALGLALEALPAVGGAIPAKIARELRVAALASAGDLLAEIVTGPLRQLLADGIRGEAAHEAVRVAPDLADDAAAAPAQHDDGDDVCEVAAPLSTNEGMVE